jgi:CheY-like chemotaxis protein
VPEIFLDKQIQLSYTNWDMSSYKVLVADDEPNIVKIMEFELKKSGYQVMTANDGQEALEIIKGNPPDLILSDIMMPNMDGYELCREVKKDPNLRGIPFIFLTAKTGLENRIQGYVLGATKYINKPCSRQDLLKAIDLRLRLAEDAKKLFAQKAKTFQGDLSIISVFSLIDMFSIGGWSGYIEMTNPKGEKGRIDVTDAMLTKYTLDGQEGDDILPLLLSWTQGKFTAERF